MLLMLCLHTLLSLRLLTNVTQSCYFLVLSCPSTNPSGKFNQFVLTRDLTDDPVSKPSKPYGYPSGLCACDVFEFNGLLFLLYFGKNEPF